MAPSGAMRKKGPFTDNIWMFCIQSMRTALMLYSSIIWQAPPLFKEMQWISNVFIPPLTFKYRFGPLLTWVGWKLKRIYMYFFYCQQNQWVWFILSPLTLSFQNAALVISGVRLRDFLVQHSENLGIMSFNPFFHRPLFVSFALCHLLLLSCPFVSSLSVWRLARSRPCWLKSLESPSWLVGWDSG